ncbi:pyruvate kinase-like isoform X2 [Leptidea sinapis]|nr:pyruvate kinase-like isoform X2 [Leptidea sinapis]
MSIEIPVAVDEDVDIVILKDVKNLPQYLNFKDNNLCEILKPILVWISSGTLTDGLKEIIRFSDGIIFDRERDYKLTQDPCICPIKVCKELQKPIFHLKPDTTLDYYSLRESKRSVFIEINEVVNSCVDGIVISDDLKSEFPPKEIVRSIIRAMALETLDNSGIVADYLEVKIPALVPLSLALGASLAASKSDAKAIIVFTKTGNSARWVSFTAPCCPIIAITRRKSTARRLNLYRKVIPLYCDVPRFCNWRLEWQSRVDFGTTFALKTGLFNSGANLVVLAPTKESIGYCNGFQIINVPF